MELCFGIERFDGFAGAGLGRLMFSWVVLTVGNDPE
jgi:hypothetical protein